MHTTILSLTLSTSTNNMLTLFSKLSMFLLDHFSLLRVITVDVFLDRMAHVSLLDLLNLLAMEVHVLEALELR